MPCITFDLTEEQKKDLKDNMKKVKPIAIVKGNKKSPHYNKFLYLDQDDKRCSKTNIIKIPEENYFEILPDTNKDTRNCFYIAGPSGAGKSYMAKQIATNYHKLYPDRRIFIISHLDQDDTLDEMDFIHRLDNEKLCEADPNVNDFCDCLFICDDYEAIPGKVGKWILNFIEQLLIMGRCHSKNEKDRQGNISVIIINHHLTNYKKTRLMLMESDKFLFYPQSTSYQQLQYVLKTHLGMEKDDVKALRKLGRWVYCSKTYPQYLMSAHECKILHQDE